MSNDLNKERLAKDALRDYMKIVEQAEADELMRFADDSYRPMEKKVAYNGEDTDIGIEAKVGGSMTRLLRYAAVLIVAITVISIAVPVQEVSAWVVWKFDAIFGEEEDHTVTDPKDENDFIQYYVKDMPADFTLVNTVVNSGQEISEYINAKGQYIVFCQIERKLFKSNIDKEHRENVYEVINNFETLVSRGDNDFYFEIITEEAVLTVHTDAGYDVGRNFITELKQL